MPQCGRCHGTLSWEPSQQSTQVRWSLGAWRCINCGEWFDLLALRNRHQQISELSIRHQAVT